MRTSTNPLRAHVNMSIDPYSGRNPSYCFVELATKEQADRAMSELNGTDMLGRPVKLGPGVAKPRGKRPHGQSGQDSRNALPSSSPIFDRWTRTDAADHVSYFSITLLQMKKLWSCECSLGDRLTSIFISKSLDFTRRYLLDILVKRIQREGLSLVRWRPASYARSPDGQ